VGWPVDPDRTTYDVTQAQRKQWTRIGLFAFTNMFLMAEVEDPVLLNG